MNFSDLYLAPPTYGEFFSSAQRLGDYLSVFDFEHDPVVWPIMFSVFELPPSCRMGTGSDSDLAKLIYNLEDGESYNDDLPSQETALYHSQLFSRLCPETTLSLGNGDCKSLAVLSVAYKRFHGRPARFLQQSPTHFIFEEYNGEVWVPKEPQMARFSAPMEYLNGEILPTPNPDLYERVYQHVIELFSKK